MNPLESILANLTSFGKDIDAFCADLRDRTQDDSVRLILYHISRWKRRIAITIACLTNAEKTENISLSQDDLAFMSERVFADTFVSSTAGKVELLDSLIFVLDVLVSYYEWLLRQSLGEHVRYFFQNLLTEQLKEIEQLKELKTNAAFQGAESK